MPTKFPFTQLFIASLKKKITFLESVAQVVEHLHSKITLLILPFLDLQKRKNGHNDYKIRNFRENYSISYISKKFLK
jgi:hypothetical protein